MANNHQPYSEADLWRIKQIALVTEEILAQKGEGDGDTLRAMIDTTRTLRLLGHPPPEPA